MIAVDLKHMTAQEVSWLDEGLGRLLAGEAREWKVRTERFKIDIRLQPPVAPAKTDPRQMGLF